MSGKHRKPGGCFGLTLGILGLVVLALWALFGCSSPPDSGYVTHKQHADAYYYDTTTMECFSYTYDKNGFSRCTLQMPVTHHNYMPATWELCVKNADDPKNVQEGCISVDESTYRKYDEGQHYPDPR